MQDLAPDRPIRISENMLMMYGVRSEGGTMRGYIRFNTLLDADQVACLRRALDLVPREDRLQWRLISGTHYVRVPMAPRLSDAQRRYYMKRAAARFVDELTEHNRIQATRRRLEEFDDKRGEPEPELARVVPFAPPFRAPDKPNSPQGSTKQRRAERRAAERRSQHKK